MSIPYANVSVLVTGTTGQDGARNFSYLRFLNTDWFTASVATLSSSFQNANNVTFGVAGSTVTASASYTWAHVAAPRSQAWSEMGVWVGTGSPASAIVYSDWLAGSNGYWGWVSIP